MGRTTRKRRTPLAVRAVAASAALALGGGGLIWANFYASADETSAAQDGAESAGAQVATITCPDVGQQLNDVPSAAKPNVDTELAALDQQITEAYARLTSTREAQTNDAGFVPSSVLGPLKDKRTEAIDRIKTDLQRAGAAAPSSLDGLAACTGTTADQAQSGAGGQNGDGRQQGSGGQAGNGPTAADFVDITKVRPNVRAKPRRSGNASTGTFVSSCGVNAGKKHNTDNVIVAPGVKNGAHHLHDYVGNQSNDAFADNGTFAAARTSCQNQQDKSSYYWPVLRVQDGTQDFDQNDDGGGKEGNVGRILTARQAQITFVGSPKGKVVAMPGFLRIITGDAKAFTNGPGNANAHWSCTGFENRVQLTDRYPICPQGSQVVRTFAFQSCWDGQNIDSANHRTHVAFAGADGSCPSGFRAIPQLTMRLVYSVPRPAVRGSQVKNAYAVDGFPEQLHKASTDHDDFINVMSANLMNKAVTCINTGRTCR
ncbi:MAG: DUF1996 domain-containing protein [Streptomyces sp.]|jgi:hypothetical protein|nr:DUF1996 domain-containing protein [Streptomyces sp.]